VLQIRTSRIFRSRQSSRNLTWFATICQSRRGALVGIRDRPLVLKRYVNGAEGEAFYQKRAPSQRPSWLRTITLAFPSGRTAEEIVVDDAAGLAWIVNLGCIELHPHPVRSDDLDHPDELRVDLDPGPGVSWADVRAVALEVKALLDEIGLRGWPKTSGSRGMHINVRIYPRWTFDEVRRAALALSRAVERRAPSLATSKWWKEERHGVFLDYNQNAKDRTTCSAYSVRPLPDARVSAPLHWPEVPDCEPSDFTVITIPKRFLEIGDPQEGIDGAVGSLEKLLELAARDEAAGLGDAPWPPHFRKTESEPRRVAPSRAKPVANTPRTKMPLIVVAELTKQRSRAFGSGKMEAQTCRGCEASHRRRRAGRFDARQIVHLDADPNKPAPCAEELRPPQRTPDPDDDPTREWRKIRASKKGT